MKIRSKDYVNEPRKEFIKNLTILFASYEIDQVKHYFTEDIIWHLVGDIPIKGKENFTSQLNEMRSNRAVQLTIHQIITDGNNAAIHGEMKMANNNQFGFSDFYVFSETSSQLVKSITSYVVNIPDSKSTMDSTYSSQPNE